MEKEEEKLEGTNEVSNQQSGENNVVKHTRPRVRIQRPVERPAANRGEGFMPEGFGYNNSQEHPRQHYGNQQGEGRPYQRQQGGYNGPQRNNGGYNNGGQRGGYNGPQRNNGGYNAGGYNNNGGQRGGYNGPQRNNGGYNNGGQRGGYNGPQRNNGGYNAGGYNNNGGQRGGYNGPQRNNNGYNNNGGNQRGGYNGPHRQFNGNGNNQGGYRNFKQQGQGYNPNAKYSVKKRIEYVEENVNPDDPIRLNKYLANAGVCSRREADDFIEKGLVTVNGEVVKELGTKVKRSDEVAFNGSPVTIEKKVYVLLNKPKDCVTTVDDPQHRRTVMDLVKDACDERIYPVGRLDRNTTGVLLLTNDGELASKLTHPKFLKKKVYQVTLDRPVEADDMRHILEGVQLEDHEVKADDVQYVFEEDPRVVGIEIHSGENRVVRRIFETLGYRVIKLDRVQFAGLTKKTVRRGDWRYLTQKEVEMLRMGAFE